MAAWCGHFFMPKRGGKEVVLMSAKDIVMQHRDDVANQLVSKIESGDTLTWKQGWKNFRSMRNGISGRPYRGANAFFLTWLGMKRGYDDPRWFTFKEIQENGYSFKRDFRFRYERNGNKFKKREPRPWPECWNWGAKGKEDRRGCFVEFWLWGKDKVEDADGNEHDETKLKSVRYYYVFNACELKHVPKLKTEGELSEDARLANGELLKMASPATIQESMEGRAYYTPMLDTITLPLFRSFKSPDEYYSTMAHEMCHSTGHPTRLNRDMKGGFGSEDYAYEELVAEFGATFVCDALGLPNTIENSAAYIKNWCEKIKEDSSYLYKAIKDAGKAADFLLDLYEAEKSTTEANEDVSSALDNSDFNLFDFAM